MIPTAQLPYPLRTPGRRRKLLRQLAGFACILAGFSLLHYANYLSIGLREICMHLLSIPLLLVLYASWLCRRHVFYLREYRLWVFCALCAVTSSGFSAYVAEGVLARTHGMPTMGEVVERQTERVTKRDAHGRLRTVDSVSVQVQYHDAEGQTQLLHESRIILPHRFHPGDTIPLYALPVVIPPEEEGAWLADGNVMMAGWGNMAYMLIWPFIPAALGYAVMVFCPVDERRLRIEEAGNARRRAERRACRAARRANTCV